MYRRRRGQTAENYDKQELLRAVQKRGNIYLTATHPAPFTPHEIYRAIFTPEEKAAVKALAASMPLLLQMNDKFYVPFSKGESIVVELPQALPCPPTRSPSINWIAGHKIQLSNFPAEMARALREWAPKYIEARNTLRMLYTDIGTVTGACNTFGQIARLWPALTVFMPNNRKDVCMQAKMKSKLPDAVMLHDDEKGWIPNPVYQKAPLWDELLASMLVFSDEMDTSQPVHVTDA